MSGDSSPLIGAIDQGTSSSRFLLFDKNGKIIHSHQEEFGQIYPREGWVEHDPMEILQSVSNCIEETFRGREELAKRVKAIGITNQRETTVVWDKQTGKPLANAIVWLDLRTASTCSHLEKKFGSKDHFRSICGLPIATYFSAMKLKWLMDNDSNVKKAIEDGNCMFGTIDSWLIWNLTGGNNGGVHCTDVTNASRTMLMDLKTLQWSPEICKTLNVPMSMLPKIKSSAEVYGHMNEGILKGIPISGCLGDQQAALVGQTCFQKGDAKNTYGTGCFMLFNTNTEIVQSTHGLLTTVGYQLGPQKKPVYALEGSIAIAGAAVQWLRDKLGIIKSAPEINLLASKVENTGNVYFVPAFSGLFAPHWRSDARGVIVGLTQYSNKNHIARATLEAVCFQTREVLEAMEKDSTAKLQNLKVDGGMTQSELMLQIQSDLIGIPVVRPESIESTGLGAAFAAGLATGIWKSEDEFPRVDGTIFNPQISLKERNERYHMWKKAVEKAIGWDVQE